MLKPSLGAALMLVTACAAQAPASVQTVSAPSGSTVMLLDAAPPERERYVPPAVDCDIRSTQTARGRLLEALVRTDRPLQGDYAFTIIAFGGGGSSDVSQGGAVDLAPGEFAGLGAAEIPDGRYRAVLTLSDAYGELCRLEQKS